MEKKFIDVLDFRLAYIEKNPDNLHTVFFIHGNSGSSNTWRYQLNDPRFQNFRLVAIDLPGHGDSSDSDKPYLHYTPLATSEILANAIHELKKDKPYSFVGFSYGTNLIAEMLNYDLHPNTIALTGSCIVGKELSLDKVLIKPESSIYFYDNISIDDAKSFLIQKIKTKDKNIIDLYLDDYKNTRIPFRSTLIQSAIEGKYSDEIEILKKYHNPLLIVYGKEDDLVNINSLDIVELNYWKNFIYKLNNAGHYVHSEFHEEFNDLLISYLNEISI